jgi:hypothetical protein
MGNAEFTNSQNGCDYRISRLRLSDGRLYDKQRGSSAGTAGRNQGRTSSRAKLAAVVEHDHSDYASSTVQWGKLQHDHDDALATP